MRCAIKKLLVTIALAALWLLALLTLLHYTSPVAQSALAHTSAERGDVVINEVAWAGTSASTADEWIELYNNTNRAIDLANWTLHISTRTLIYLSGVISAHGYYLIERTDDQTVCDVPADLVCSFGSSGLRNAGDVLTLTDPYGHAIDTANGNGGPWPAGTASPSYKSMERIDPAGADTDANWASNDGVIRNGHDANNAPINGTPRQPNSAAFVTPPSVVLINGVLYDGYQYGDKDEAIQIVNLGPGPIHLQNWSVTKGTSPGAVFPSYTLPVNASIWAARNATEFSKSFGMWPGLAMAGTLTQSPALTLTGSWPGLGESADVQLKNAAGVVVDRLVYGDAALPAGGWTSPTLSPFRVAPRGFEGQILARVPDERTGLPISDTDTARDWLQYSGSYTTGRRVMYAGWDMDPFFWPLASTAPATLTLGIAPDHAFDVTRDAIRSARRSLEIEAYELKSYGIITEVVQKARMGVSVTVLLEGGPPGGMDDQQLWACQEVERAGGRCWFMSGDARYYLIHAKLIILDRQRLLVSTQNMSGGGMPDDDKSDGTWGSRGYVLYIQSLALAERAGRIFDHDCDPAHHADIARWGAPGFGEPATGYAPITTSGGATTTVRFPFPQVVTDAVSLEWFTAPEAALRRSDALLGLLARAGQGDEVYVEQMVEYPDWGDAVTAPNLRLQAYVDAARRGARVRILLNGGTFDQDYIDLTENMTTTAWVNQTARQEMLDLQARMADPTRYGIHGKLVLVRLHDGAGPGNPTGYSHMGSINGSEASSKINREVAVQVESLALYAELARVFESDWSLAGPIYMPLVMRNYSAAQHVVISEVLYDPYGAEMGKEWVELYNPTNGVIDLSGWSLGDAARAGEYASGRYRFPDGTVLRPGGVIVIAQQAVSVTLRPDLEFLVDPDPSLDDPTVPNMIPSGAWDGFGLTLGNTGDQVALLDAAGQPVDAVVWGDGSYPGTGPHPGVSGGDHSLERFPANEDGNDCAADFRERYPATPGAVPY